ncbi:MAG: S16 family serine protease, partial [Vampirovibrionales bacterium]|nr:S16 family serine protease [Vampirovibrionales bacterium]
LPGLKRFGLKPEEFERLPALSPSTIMALQMSQVLSGIKTSDILSKGSDDITALKETLEAHMALPEDERVMTQAQYDDINGRIKNLGNGLSIAGTDSYPREQIETILTQLPWRKDSKPVSIDLAQAALALNEEHEGLQELKTTLLEKLAAQKRAQGLSNGQSSKAPKILCLVGAPGVGKTTLGKQLAKAMNHEFASVNLAGLDKATDISGMSYGYIGARPGVVMSALKGKPYANRVVMMLDEVDKLGSGGMHGNPFYALLEVLDPAQNKQFRDRYLRLDYDLSGVTFVLTANDAKNIPPALLDRVEVVQVPDYSIADKMTIARKHILPKVRQSAGLTEKDLPNELLSDPLLLTIIDKYAFSGGVRRLEHCLEQIARKRALQLDNPAMGPKHPLSQAHLGEWITLGFAPPEKTQASKVGRVNGLFYLSGGGGGAIGPKIATKLPPVAIQIGQNPIEVSLIHGGMTGKSSVDAVRRAATYIENHVTDLNRAGIKFELPQGTTTRISIGNEGYTESDGPSAGVADTTLILSVLSGRKIKGNVAMTGQITPLGDIKAIGGLLGKIEGAYRAGCTKVLIPWENWDEKTQQVIDGGKPVTFSPEVLKAVDIVPVKRYEDVIPHAFEPPEDLSPEGNPAIKNARHLSKKLNAVA